MTRDATTVAVGEELVEVWPLGDEHLDVAAHWLTQDRNARWLDFGSASGLLSPLGLKLMTQREQHCIWVYGPPGERTPAGLVAFGNIQARFRTAEAWCVLGAKDFGRKDLTMLAVCRLLAHGFDVLRLRSIYAWTVEINRGGRRLLERCGFRFAGRLRESHAIDGKVYDRLWFDLLAHEFKGYRAYDH